MERNIKPEQELSGAYTGFTGLMCRENDGVLELWETPAIFMAVIPVSCGRKACGVRYASHCAEGQ